MALNYWRPRAAKAIRQVIADHPKAAGVDLMRLLQDAYPFGIRDNFAYRVWRSEVRYQLGIEERPRRKLPCRLDPVPPGQGALW